MIHSNPFTHPVADWSLIYLGLVIPLSNLNFYVNVPTFNVTKRSVRHHLGPSLVIAFPYIPYRHRHWPTFYAFLMGLGVSGAEMPLPHSLLQWALATPMLT